MSLILDALRKMEQERRSRRGSAQDLRPEVLRYRLAAQPKEPRRYPVAVVAGTALLLAGIGAGFLLKGHAPEPAREPGLAAAPAPQVPATPAPVAPPAAPAVAPVTVAPPAVPPAPAPPAATAVAGQSPVAIPQSVAPPTGQARKASRAAAVPRSLPSDAPQMAPQEPAAATGGAQDITISGIAYQDERRLRRAVLNGILVGEGAEVGGARVVEIKETKVRLSRGGRVFEVPFSSGLQSR
ncbi:general secretion pathway protein GspB [Geomonas sp. Red69]|uniref:General secretion pathway protein GspB n=1 Tax=Geomonas diazotrophica TaxID=2843197 RepID=A0ABX8JI38_9BACT|nr:MULTISPECIES: general secretion pathway protein GspB [Geomonas]MBU5637794.1 general secretion pathway protein GspB [Geomonas diazotrophica]QWV96327.1 general secretion pathway protein GspB [Geomonas nitrogeniifigens]QXE85394.1 general secretion pathway protein GspB [Geomonas nitrogeniifigens]